MGKTWLKIGARVQLKTDESSDGKIISSHGKGYWTVAWEQNAAQSRHHSKGLKQWAFVAPQSDSSDSDSDESGGEENDETGPISEGAETYERKVKEFERTAKSLVGKSVTVAI